MTPKSKNVKKPRAPADHKLCVCAYIYIYIYIYIYLVYLFLHALNVWLLQGRPAGRSAEPLPLRQHRHRALKENSILPVRMLLLMMQNQPWIENYEETHAGTCPHTFLRL